MLRQAATLGEAFATKYMRDMCHGRETADFQVYAWDIEVPEDPDEKVKSPKFKCGGHEWWARAVCVFSAY